MKKEEHFFASNVRTLQETAAFGRSSSFEWSRAGMTPSGWPYEPELFSPFFRT